MHEVAKSRSRALAHFVLTTASLSEVCYWRQFSVDRSAAEPAIVQVVHSPFRVFLSAKLDVNIAHQVIAEIVAYVHLLDLAILVFTFDENVFEEVVIMLLHFLIRYICDQMRAIRALGRVLRIYIQILKQTCLAERGLVVDTRASVTVTAGADFKVKGAVYFVFLGSEDRR